MFHSIAHRAWHAYYCLPRDEKGAPPSLRGLERPENPDGPSNGAIGKLFRSDLRGPGPDVLARIATVLACDLTWLITGKGPAPSTANQIPEFPYHSEAAEAAAGLPKRAKVALDGQTKKLANSGLARRTKRASK